MTLEKLDIYKEHDQSWCGCGQDRCFDSFQNTDVWRHKVLFIEHGDWNGVLNALYGNLPKSVLSCTSTLTWFMVGRGNVFFTYTEETQYPVPLPNLRPMVIHTFQPSFDLSVICQTFRFDFSHLTYSCLPYSLSLNCTGFLMANHFFELEFFKCV